MLDDETACKVAQTAPEFADDYQSEKLGRPACNPFTTDMRVRSLPCVIEWASSQEAVADGYRIVEVPDSVPVESLVLRDYDGVEMILERGHFWPEW